MAYTTPAKVRDEILGVEESDAPDSVLNNLINEATKIVIRRLTVRVLDEEPDTSPTADPKEFYSQNQFIADVNGDKIVNTTDIHAYTWTDPDDEDTKVEVVVASLNPLTGRIVLVDDPGTKTVTIDYSYYLNKMDWDLVDLAAAYYAAKMWVERELLLVPATVRIGRLSLRHHEYWKVLDSEFERVMHLLTSCPMDKVCYEKMVIGTRAPTLKEEIEATEVENKVCIPEDIC